MVVKETDLIENLQESDIHGVMKSLVDGVVVTWAYWHFDHANGTCVQTVPAFPARPLCTGKEDVRIEEDADTSTRAKLQNWLEGPRNTTFTLFKGSRLPGYRHHHRDYRPAESAWALYQEMKRGLAAIEQRNSQP
jgi:hypothetical protein